MKKFIILFLTFIVAFFSGFSAFAEGGLTEKDKKPNSILSNTTATSDENILGIDNDNLREGNVNIDTIPIMLATIANYIMMASSMVAIFMLIFFAFKMQINSGITGDSSGVDRSRKGMIAAVVGFVISVSAWFVMARVIDILAMASK